MKIKLLFLAWLLVPARICADDLVSSVTAYTYVVYRASFNAGAYNVVKNFGFKDDRIKLKNTRDMIAPNTNYARITITPRLVTELNAMKNSEAQGKGILLYTTQYFEWMDPVRGLVKDVRRTNYNPLPADFNLDWSEVVVSSQ